MLSVTLASHQRIDVEESSQERDSWPSGLAFVCQPYHRGGVTGWMLEAAREWQRRDRAAWLIAPSPAYRFPSGGGATTIADMAALLPAAHRPVVIAPQVGTLFELGTRAYRATRYEKWIMRSVPAGTALIVSDDPAVWGAAARLSVRNPMIGVLHADDEAYYALARAHASALHGLVCVSARIATRAREEVAGEGVPIAIIPCGIAEIELGPGAPPRMSERRLVWAGRVEERTKRVSDLPSILAALCARGIDAHLDIVGDGPDLPQLRDAILRARLTSNVTFHGWQSASVVHEVLRRGDVLLLPSNTEGMPVVVMEALMRGCGVVASNVNGLADLAAHPDASMVLRTHGVGDVNAAVAAIDELLRANPLERRAVAHAFARRHCSIAGCMDRYADFLGELGLAHGLSSGRAKRMERLRVTLASAAVALARWARREWNARRAGKN